MQRLCKHGPTAAYSDEDPSLLFYLILLIFLIVLVAILYVIYMRLALLIISNTTKQFYLHTLIAHLFTYSILYERLVESGPWQFLGAAATQLHVECTVTKYPKDRTGLLPVDCDQLSQRNPTGRNWLQPQRTNLTLHTASLMRICWISLPCATPSPTCCVATVLSPQRAAFSLGPRTRTRNF